MGRKKKSASTPAKPATYDIEQVRAYARGQWSSLLSAIVGLDSSIVDPKRHFPCPKAGCGGTDRFRVYNDFEETGGVICNQCGRNCKTGFDTIMWLLDCTFVDALRKVAEWLGVAPAASSYHSNGSTKSNADPAEHLAFQPWDEGTDSLAGLWCLGKPPIVVPAIKRCGARLARYRDKFTVIALPVWGESLSTEKPVGWTLYNVTGGPLETFSKDKDGQWVAQNVKILTTYGSKSGFIGPVDEIRAASTLWKLEGPSDLLAFYSLAGIPSGTAAVTNCSGAGEKPAKWMVDLFMGKSAIVLHDADEAGQKGAVRWAGSVSSEAADTKIAKLPFDSVEEKGADLRDYLNLGRTFGDLHTLAASAPLEERAPATPVSTSEPLESFDNYHRLARLNLERYQRSTRNGMLRYWRNEWYKYDGFCYRKIDETELKAKVGQAVREEFERVAAEQFRDWDGEGEAPTIKQVTQSLVSNVLFATSQMCILSGTVELNTWTDGENKDSDDRFVALKNGILNIDRLLSGHPDHLLPHSPHWFSVTCLPFDFDPQALSPIFDKFLKKNLENDKQRIDLLMEWAGYLLLPNTDYQKFMFFEGEGSNGKSVFLAAIEAMIGESNCSHVSLESFGKDFILTQTLGKLVNIASECSEMDLVAEGMLKAFASGDRMTFNRKGIPPIEAAPTARLMLSANVRPRFADKSSGLWRRMILMPWRVTIADGEKTIGMDKVGWWEESGELPGIFNWALAGLDQLNANKRFTKSEVCEAALSSYRSEMNPIKVFFEENYIKDETQNFMVGAQYMYEHYREWCFARNYKAFSDGAFGRELARHFKEAVKKRHWEKDQDGKPIRVAYYHGIRNLSRSDDKESEDDPVEQLQLQEF